MQKRILLFGNSGSGKSTFAQYLSKAHGLAHLDLDTLAWRPTTPPERRPIAESARDIEQFVSAQASWVIEGCYSDLLALAAKEASEAIWMNLAIEDCVANAQARPWEPHKYPSKEAQDANLAMLLEWIRQYESRTDTFSAAAHREFYEAFAGDKREITKNERR